MNKKLLFIPIITAGFIFSLFQMQSASADTTPPPSGAQEMKLSDSSQTKGTTNAIQSEDKKISLSAIDHGSQYFTNVSFTDIAGNPLAKVNDSDKVKVNYNFSIPGDIHENEIMSIPLPEQLQMVNYTDFPIMDASGTFIAKASTDKTTGLITITFTDAVENKTDINGSLIFWTKFDKEKLLEGENTFAMPLQGVTTDLTLNVHKVVSTGTGTTNPTVIFKSGSFDKNDPSLINWTVTINNAHQNLLQPKVIDTMGPGQNLVPGTFTFNYRDEKKKSLNKFTLPAGDEVSQGRTRVTLNATGFDIIFENFGSYSTINNYYSAVVTYQTKVDASTTRYVNGVGTLDELGQPQKRNASVVDYGSGGIASGNTQEAVDNLTDTIDSATSLDSSVLTPEDSTKLEEAIQTAQNVVDNETATKEQLDESSNELGHVVEEVTPSDVPPVNEELEQALKDLEQLVQETKEIDPAPYTEDTWQNVETALKESETLLLNEEKNPGSATLEDVKNSSEQLHQALEGLETKEHEAIQGALDQLQKLVAVAETTKELPYTKESWDVLVHAKEEAKDIIRLGVDKVTLQDVLEKQKQLQEALENLVEKVNSPSSSSSPQEVISNIPNATPGRSLPATGEQSNVFLIIGGIFIAILTIVVAFYLNKRQRN